MLCEQVVGRGLRRTSYDVSPDGLFEPEYVNIFGVPFTFLPHEGGEDIPPPPPEPTTAIEPLRDREVQFEISWPNVVRIDHTYRPHLSLDWERVKPLQLDAGQTARIAELAPIIDGKPDLSKVDLIDLEALAREFRTQKIIFETARDVYDQMERGWRGGKVFLLAQLVRLVEQFIRSDRIWIAPTLFHQDDLTRRLVITLNMTKVVQHIREAIRFENAQRLRAGVRPRSSDSFNRRHAHMAHSQALRTNAT